MGFRRGFKKELGAAQAEHEENGVDRAALNPKWNMDTAISMMVSGGRSTKTVLGKPAPSNSRFGIALGVLHDLLPELSREVKVVPVDVVAAARRARGFASARNAKLLWE